MEEKISMELEKETKNTYRYEEKVEKGKPPVIRNIYIAKWKVGENPPENLEITISD